MSEIETISWEMPRITKYELRPLTDDECINWTQHGLPLTPPSDNLPPPLYVEWVMNQVPMEAPWLCPDTDLPLPMCTIVANPQQYREYLSQRYIIPSSEINTG